MKKIITGLFLVLTVFAIQFILSKVYSSAKAAGNNLNILFLHHSTGSNIWNGGLSQFISKYNAVKSKNYQIKELAYPFNPYPWSNYPYDYWNLWVNHSENNSYQQQYTLEQLSKYYNVIMFKHCFPVSNIKADTGSPNISSNRHSLENYKLQYIALRKKMRQFPNVKFIVWTGAALTERNTNPESARRAKMFFDWVKNSWDQKGDNIYIWDFYTLETNGGLYLRDEYASSPSDSHPNRAFSKYAAEKLSNRLINVIENRGDSTSLTGN